MTCNLCGGALESPKDFDRGFCFWHETLTEAGIVRPNGAGFEFEAPPAFWRRLGLTVPELA